MAGLTRREFLRAGLAAGAGAALGIPSAQASTTAAANDRDGMLVDLTRCIGCRACVRACSDRNGLPRQSRATALDGPAEPLTFALWTTVNPIPVPGDRPQPVKRQCMHCLEPACVSVCPVGALHQTETGAVIYRAERCIGCRYCMLACPFEIPKFQWDSGATPVIGKCQFCQQPGNTGNPACAEACPTGTLKFGKRADLLTEAHYRVRVRPDKYVKHVYGEFEAGGTAWLYISGRSFAQLGFPRRLPLVPLPSLTRMAMHILPAVVAVLAVGLSALSILFRRLRPHEEEHAPHA